MASALALQCSTSLSYEDPYTGGRPFCILAVHIISFCVSRLSRADELVYISFNPFRKFLRLGNPARDFFRVNVCPGIFFGCVGSPWDVFGF